MRIYELLNAAANCIEEGSDKEKRLFEIFDAHDHHGMPDEEAMRKIEELLKGD